MQTQTQTDKPREFTLEQHLLKALVLCDIADILTAHNDGTIGFCAFDTNGKIVHMNYKLSADKMYAIEEYDRGEK